ncbi:MAG: hypothetical protein M3081_14860 [Gemmatimonadota bacterium]|nr:hypothetical protein [Gemmatimonadota bacterium]
MSARAVLDGVRSLASILREPVRADSRRHLREKWEALPPALRTPRQMYGRQGGGCGATIGAMPRCDFACRGCYLGAGANAVPALPLEDVKRQIRVLRTRLGHAGDLQLTDGEITLRPVGEVIELVRYARAAGLIPMLMTHGDSFRRRPGLLERLIVEGGLSEVSIHVDTTQRGRTGAAYKHAAREEDLMPLRDEFAALVRAARASTGRALRCAMTMTVTRENLAGVAPVVRWTARNADVVHLISFQPIAQVGRTEAGLGGGVDIEALWSGIADGLFDAERGAGDGARAEFLDAHVHFGHPACNRVVPGLVVRDDAAKHEVRYVSLRRAAAPDEARVVSEFFARFGGVSFRLDSPARRAARALALIAHAPALIVGGTRVYGRSLLRRAANNDSFRFAWRLARRRASVHSLMLVSHHFMSREECETPLGRERLDSCVFHVPVGDDLVPMCTVNTSGVRDTLYLSQADGDPGRA